MSEKHSKYSEDNYQDKVDYEVVKSYETIDRLSSKNSNLFSLLLLVAITLIALIIIFQWKTIKELDPGVKISTLEGEIQTLYQRVQTLEQREETLKHERQRLEQRVRILERKIDKQPDPYEKKW